MENFYRMATALVFILFYLEAEQFTEASSIYSGSRHLDSQPGQNIRSFFCGSVLTKTLEDICGGKFNDFYRNQKKNSAELPDGESSLWAAIKESSTYPFRTKQIARAFIPDSLRRHRRGIVDECCAKQCTISEMLGYCGA